MGDKSISIPILDGMADGTYTLKVFAEDVNSTETGNLTDYASNMAEFSIRVRDYHKVDITISEKSHIISPTDGILDYEHHRVKAGDAMTSVTYTAEEGYFFPEDYRVLSQNGISVTRSADGSQITVSGTPTADVDLTLTPASQISVLTPTPKGTAAPVLTPTAVPQKTPAAKLKKGVIRAYAKWMGHDFKVSWNKQSGVSEYKIYAVPCGKDMNKKSLCASVNGTKKSVVLKKIEGKKLSRSKDYKVKVKAYAKVNGKKVCVGRSVVCHVAGKTNKKHTNAKKVKVSKKTVVLRKEPGISHKIKAFIVKETKKKSLLSKEHDAKLRYDSTDTSVATVTKDGKVIPKKRGICYIYVTALNGKYNRVKVLVHERI